MNDDNNTHAEATAVHESPSDKPAETTLHKRAGDPRRRPSAKKTKTPMIITLVIFAILVIPLSLGAAYVNQYDKIYPNTFVWDIDLGGKTVEQATELLGQVFYPEKVKDLSIPLLCKDITADLPLNNLEVSYDNGAVAAEAFNDGIRHNIITKAASYVSHLVHKKELEPKAVFNHDALMAIIDEVTAPYEIDPVGYTFKIEPDKVTIGGPVDGIKVDRDLVEQEVENQLQKMNFQTITLNPVVTTPARLDMDEFYTWLTSDAQNAYYEKVDGKVTVHPGKLKCTVSREAVEEAVRSISKDTGNITELAVKTTPPEVTSDQLKQTLYQDTLGSYSTNYTGSAARINNVQLATGRVDGVELMPGEEFSYDKTILPRNRSNGYQAAPVYVGNKVESGMGGGICQPSSTLYAAALYANLEIIERHNHSLKVSYLPPGMDATIAEGYLDFRFKNSTGYPIKIAGSAGGGVVSFSILGYNPDGYQVEILRSGGDNTYYVTRVVKKDGAEVSREQMTSSHYSTPEPSSTPKPVN